MGMLAVLIVTILFVIFFMGFGKYFLDYVSNPVG